MAYTVTESIRPDESTVWAKGKRDDYPCWSAAWNRRLLSAKESIDQSPPIPGRLVLTSFPVPDGGRIDTKVVCQLLLGHSVGAARCGGSGRRFCPRGGRLGYPVMPSSRRLKNWTNGLEPHPWTFGCDC